MNRCAVLQRPSFVGRSSKEPSGGTSGPGEAIAGRHRQQWLKSTLLGRRPCLSCDAVDHHSDVRERHTSSGRLHVLRKPPKIVYDNQVSPASCQTSTEGSSSDQSEEPSPARPVVVPTIRTVVASSDTPASTRVHDRRRNNSNPLARTAASNLANVSPCPKLLRTVISRSIVTCSSPAHTVETSTVGALSPLRG